MLLQKKKSNMFKSKKLQKFKQQLLIHIEIIHL